MKFSELLGLQSEGSIYIALGSKGSSGKELEEKDQNEEAQLWK